MSSFTVVNALIAGVVGTIAMDVFAAVGMSLHVFRMPAFGRWFLHGLKGKFRHDDIDKSPAVRGENALTLPLHYLAGVVLAGFYLLLLDWLALGRGNFLMAAGYGLATAAIPLFIMLPSMGYGLLGIGRDRSTFWLRQILAFHLAYGVGIGIAMILFVSP